MNVNPGGKQPKMRPGWYLLEREAGKTVRVKQHMVFEGGPLKGQAKGLRQVCSERFGMEAIDGMIRIYTTLFWKFQKLDFICEGFPIPSILALAIGVRNFYKTGIFQPWNISKCNARDLRVNFRDCNKLGLSCD